MIDLRLDPNADQSLDAIVLLTHADDDEQYIVIRPVYHYHIEHHPAEYYREEGRTWVIDTAYNEVVACHVSDFEIIERESTWTYTQADNETICQLVCPAVWELLDEQADELSSCDEWD